MREQFVVLVRHGIAEDKGTKNDFDRELTEAGAKKMKKIGRALATVFPDADTIYSSPLVRAMQTAERIADAYGSKLRISQTDALRSEATVAYFRELIAHAGGENIICVGHEPNLSTIVEELADARIVMKKGGCCGLRFSSSGSAQLEWLAPPHILTGAD